MSVVTRTHPSLFRNTKKNERAESQLNARDKRKKKAKQAIDNPNAGKLKRRTDPGVPNLSGVISRLQQQHDNNKYVKRDQANAKKREDMMKKRKELSVPLTTEQSLLRAAQQSDEFHFEMKDTAKDSDVAKRRPFWKELTKVIEAADIILEVLDARDPLGCRCPDVENVIKAKMTADGAQNKRIILVLNKIDLAPMDNVLAWVKYFRREYPCIAFKANTQQQKNNMSQSTAKASQVDTATLSRSHCIGGDQLRQLLKNYSRSHDMKKSVTVGIIGYPNVGKSSIINSLKRSGAVHVGATPGLTKTLQEVKLDKQISLIDSPGVMFSAGSDSDEEGLLLRNCLRVEQLANPERAVYAIVKRCTSDTLTRIYEIPNFHNADEFIAQVAMRRNKLLQKGGLDLESTARMIVKDWNDGKIPYHTNPPVSEGVIQSDVVGAWSKTFDIDALMNPSIEHVDEDEMDDDQDVNHVVEEDEKQEDIVPRPLNASEMEDDSTSDERLLAAHAAIQQSTSSSSSTSSQQSVTSSRVIPTELQKNKQLKHTQKEQRLQQRRMSQAAAGPVTDLMDS